MDIGIISFIIENKDPIFVFLTAILGIVYACVKLVLCRINIIEKRMERIESRLTRTNDKIMDKLIK